MQQALVLELQGSLDEAAEQARAATEREPTNWETWFVLSRIQAQRGKDGAALKAFRTARSLDPKSPLLNPEQS
jgi:cytochrome c-type biogenesis protein CcmH/NrfG